MLPCISWLMYLLLRYFRREYPGMPLIRTVLAAGGLSGLILHIKFNSLGMSAAFILMLSLATLISRDNGYTLPGRVLHTLLRLVVFLAGLCLATLPGLIYFLYNRAVDSWLHVYFYLNIFVYGERLTLTARLMRIYELLKDHFMYNRVVFSVVAAGLAIPLLFILICALRRDFDPFNKGDTSEKILWEYAAWVVSGALAMAGIFGGGVGLMYYSLPLTLWAIGGLLVPGRLMDEGLSGGRAGLFITAVIFGCSIGGAIIASPNVSYASVKEEELWLTHFRDEILTGGVEHPMLLNVGCFDQGLYTVCDIYPDCRFFQTQTIHLDDVRQVQSAYIREQRADYLLTRDEPEERAEGLYELIREETQELGGVTHTYYLYRKMQPESE